MHPYLRLAGVVASSLRAPRVDILEPARLSLRVMPGDVEVSRMNNGRFVTLMDLGRIDLSVRSGLLGAAVRRRWFPVVASLSMRYRRSLRLGERFDLVTHIRSWDEKWWYIEHRFELGTDLAAMAYVKAVFRGPEGNVAPSAMFAAAGKPAPEPPPLPEAMRLWLAAEEAMRAAG